MFESLNFQLTLPSAPLEAVADRPDTGVLLQSATEGAWPPFSSLLSVRTGIEVTQNDSGGEILPENGKSLPPLLPVPPSNRVHSLPGSMPEVDAAVVERQELERTPDRDRDRNPEPEVISVLPEMPASVFVPIVRLPSQISATIDTDRVQVGADADTDVRSNQDIAVIREAQPPRELHASVVMTTQNLLVPTANAPAALPNLANSSRDTPIRTSPLVTTASGSPIDSADELADIVRDNTTGPLARTLEVLTPVRRLDAKVMGTTSLHSGTPVHMPAAISQFGDELSLHRGSALPESISTPVRDPAWSQMLGERVVVLAERQMKSVEIRLTPADLGPLRVQISVEDGATNVTFQVQHAVTREVIEQALPRLREMLADSGLSLGQTDVNEQDVASGNPDRDAAATAAVEVIADESANEPPDSRLAERNNVSVSNLLDTFV